MRGALIDQTSGIKVLAQTIEIEAQALSGIQASNDDPGTIHTPGLWIFDYKAQKYKFEVRIPLIRA